MSGTFYYTHAPWHEASEDVHSSTSSDTVCLLQDYLRDIPALNASLDPQAAIGALG